MILLQQRYIINFDMIIFRVMDTWAPVDHSPGKDDLHSEANNTFYHPHINFNKTSKLYTCTISLIPFKSQY